MGNYCCTEWLDSLWTPIPPLCVLAFKTVLVAVFWMNLALPVVKEGFIDDKANLIIRNYVYLWAIIAFHIVYLLLLISFMLAMFITPGNIPKVNVSIPQHFLIESLGAERTIKLQNCRRKKSS